MKIKSFLIEEQLVGEDIVMITIGRDVKVIHLATIWRDTPYFRGTLMLLKSLICDPDRVRYRST
jgi:hypothetical protein